MARKAKRSNGKANGKAKKERLHCDAGMIPFKHRKLTPERARQWMREEYPGFQDLVMDGQGYATDDRDRRAFHNLANQVKEVVEACCIAIETGEAVYLEAGLQDQREDERFSFWPIGDLVRVLRFRSIVGDQIIMTDGMEKALDALFREAQSYVDAAAKLEHEAERIDIRAHLERKWPPERHLQTLHEQHDAEHPGKPPEGYAPTNGTGRAPSP
jgi:hypothetical protein